MIVIVLLILALCFFIASTFDVIISRINPISAGLACLTLALLVPAFIG